MTAVLSTAQDAFFDVLKTVPLLLLVYALLYYIENRLTDTPALLSRTAQFGPAVGALAGSIPQCGFSAAASALFSAGYLAPGNARRSIPRDLGRGRACDAGRRRIREKHPRAAHRQVRSCRTRRLPAALYRVPRREVQLDEPLEIELNACRLR